MDFNIYRGSWNQHPVATKGLLYIIYKLNNGNIVLLEIFLRSEFAHIMCPIVYIGWQYKSPVSLLKKKKQKTNLKSSLWSSGWESIF